MITAQEANIRSLANHEKTLEGFMRNCEMRVKEAAELGKHRCSINIQCYKHTNLSSTYKELKKAGYETSFRTDKNSGECIEITLSWEHIEIERDSKLQIV
jgi:hypothetical protein